MTWFEALFVLVAGIGAGTINAVVGSGTLLTFPALLAVGIPPVLANVSNNTSAWRRCGGRRDRLPAWSSRASAAGCSG